MGEQGLNRGQKGQCSPHSAHLAPSPHKASSRETSRANKGFLSSQAFPLGRALTKAVPAAAGEKGRENELILDEKEPHPFASFASAIPRAGHTEQGWVGRQGQQRLQDTAMPLAATSSCKHSFCLRNLCSSVPTRQQQPGCKGLTQ